MSDIQNSPERVWTAFPPLPLLNVGTPSVESLEHYVSRLAWILGTGIVSLVSLAAPYDEPGIPQVRRSSFCGPGKGYKRRIRNLQELTGVRTLFCGSFYALDALLAAGAVGRRQGVQRWCPQCFAEWDEATSCEPLQWAIDIRATCPIHGCNLEDRCRRCGSQSKRSRLYEARRRCSACQGDLGGEGVPASLRPYASWQEEQLSELVELCSDPGQPPISGDAFELFVREMRGRRRAKCRRTTQALHRLTPLKSSSVHLHTLIGACALQGISVRDLLRSPIEAASAPLQDGWAGYQPLPIAGEQASKVLALLFEAMLSKSRIAYLPDPRTCMQEVGVRPSELTQEAQDAYHRYELRYQQQPTNMLGGSDSTIFREAMALSKAKQPNPFRRKLRPTRDVFEVLSTDRDCAIKIFSFAAQLRRDIELTKAKVLGLSSSELRTQVKLGFL